MKKIIIFDDDETSVQQFKERVESWPELGYTVLHNEKFEKDFISSEHFHNEIIPNFLKKVDENNEDLEAIFLDLQFNIGTSGIPLGYHLGKKIRKKYFDLPIIIYSIFSAEKINSSGLIFDFDGYIYKSKWGQYDSEKFKGAVDFASEKRKAMLKNISESGMFLDIRANKYFSTAELTNDNYIFVVMPFNNKIVPKDFYEVGIKQSIEDYNKKNDTDLKPFRVDEEKLNGIIMNQIFSSIWSSKLVIAVLTDLNPNVMYELGLAHLLNKEVVLVTNNFETLPFDIKHHRCLKYEDGNINDFKKELMETISSIISKKKNNH